MKKLGKLFLIALLCFSIVGCGGRSTTDITKDFKDGGFELDFSDKDSTNANDTVFLSKKGDGSESIQLFAEIKDKKVVDLGYIYLPENSEDYSNLIIGYFYSTKDAGYEISDDAKKAAEKTLKKFDLTTEEFIEYAQDVYAEKGK